MENKDSTDVVKEDDRKIFIGGLSYDTTENDLREYFVQFGEVENVNLKKDPFTLRSRGFAFVLFKSQEGSNGAMKPDFHLIKERQCEPKRAKARQGKVFVGGLKAEISDTDIRTHFSQYGNIVDVETPFDKMKNQRKGFCFIIYEDENVIKEILKNSRQTINDVEVEVKKATPRNDMLWGFPGHRGARGRGGGRGRGYGWVQDYPPHYDGGYYGGYGGFDGYGYDYGGYAAYNYGN